MVNEISHGIASSIRYLDPILARSRLDVERLCCERVGDSSRRRVNNTVLLLRRDSAANRFVNFDCNVIPDVHGARRWIITVPP
jgi:hypothetical protein